MRPPQQPVGTSPRPVVINRGPVAAPHPGSPASVATAAPTAPPAARPLKPAGDEPLELAGDHGAAAPSKIRAFGVTAEVKAAHTWKRAPHVDGCGAVRVRSFHGRLSDQGLEYLDNAVNEWLDGNPDIEVKFVTSTIGIFEGKIKDLALILNLWY